MLFLENLMQIKLLVLLALALSGLLRVSSSFAAGTISEGQRLAATCTGCHGTHGVTAGDALPSLAGQPKEALLASLKAFRDGTRDSTIMRQLARGYTDEQLATIAAYFAAQKNPQSK
jgi:cytochrome c553